MVLLLLTWAHAEHPARYRGPKTLSIIALDLPDPQSLRPHLDVFRLAGIWELDSPAPAFGGYSALVPISRRRMMAISDQGRRMMFNLPGAGEPNVRFGNSNKLFAKGGTRDIESATLDPTGKIMLMGVEGANSIVATDRRWRGGRQVAPPLIAGWGRNSGAEAMVWLRDGRVVLLREITVGLLDPAAHEAVVFDGNPVNGARGHAFRFMAEPSFSTTDMAQMPDGRVLILMRRLVWPMPQRFAGRIVIADPREIRPGAVWHGQTVASLSSSLPVDNFEGMAILPERNGRLAVWIISDDNKGALQRTLLWKLTVDPADLPR
jgi:hypothetical protein